MKYNKINEDKWIIDTSQHRGSVRAIDLVSRNPDQLREFDSKEAAVVFEEECYQEAEKLKAAGEDWSQYRYIPRKKLTIPEDQRQLHDSLVGEIRDGNRDVTEAVHARADQHDERLVSMTRQCDAIEKKIDKLNEHHEKAPPRDDLALMEKVMLNINVGRMNEILNQFKVVRPAGVKKAGKAKLIVEHVPRDELLGLLSPPHSEPKKRGLMVALGEEAVSTVRGSLKGVDESSPSSLQGASDQEKIESLLEHRNDLGVIYAMTVPYPQNKKRHRLDDQ